MFKLKRIITILITAVLLISFAACNSNDSEKTGGVSSEKPAATTAPTNAPDGKGESVEIKNGGTVNLSVGKYSCLNPLTTNNEDIRIYMGLVCESLVRIDELQRPQPAVIKSWVHSEDCKVWEFTVDEKAVFHDGTKVDAKSVKAVIDYIKTRGGNYAENVKNIAGCFVKDEMTVQLVLIAPDSLMASKMAIPLLSVASMEAYTQADTSLDSYLATVEDLSYINIDEKYKTYYSAADKKLAGAGMYKLSGIEGSTVNLARFDDFYSEERKPYIEGVKITEYATEYEKYGSDFDFALFYGSKAASYVFDEKTTILDYTGKTCTYVAINCRTTYTHESKNSMDNSLVYTDLPNPFYDARVRKAVCLLMDRALICGAAASKGSAVMLPAYRGTAYWNNKYNVEGINVDEALRLMNEAGYSKSEVDGNWYYKDGTALVIEAISLIDNMEVRLMMQNVKTSLAAIGLQVNLQELADADFERLYSKNHYMLMPMQVDLGTWVDIESIFSTNGELNLSFYSNATVDKYFEQLRTLTDPAVISAGYNAIEEILLADNPIICLYISGDSLAYREDMLGIERGSIYSWDPLANFHKWGVRTEQVAE